MDWTESNNTRWLHFLSSYDLSYLRANSSCSLLETWKAAAALCVVPKQQPAEEHLVPEKRRGTFARDATRAGSISEALTKPWYAWLLSRAQCLLFSVICFQVFAFCQEFVMSWLWGNGFEIPEGFPSAWIHLSRASWNPLPINDCAPHREDAWSMLIWLCIGRANIIYGGKRCFSWIFVTRMYH